MAQTAVIPHHRLPISSEIRTNEGGLLTKSDMQITSHDTSEDREPEPVPNQPHGHFFIAMCFALAVACLSVMLKSLEIRPLLSQKTLLSNGTSKKTLLLMTPIRTPRHTNMSRY